MTVTLQKLDVGLYAILRNGERIGTTATHPRVFPRHWWASEGPKASGRDFRGTPRTIGTTAGTRREAVAAFVSALDAAKEQA